MIGCITHDDALTALKLRLKAEAPATWAALRDALRTERDEPWLDRAQRAALDVVLGD